MSELCFLHRSSSGPYDDAGITADVQGSRVATAVADLLAIRDRRSHP